MADGSSNSSLTNTRVNGVVENINSKRSESDDSCGQQSDRLYNWKVFKGDRSSEQ
jgi:hypothetical protein